MGVITSNPQKFSNKIHRKLSSADTNLTSVKVGASNFAGIQCYNSGTLAFLKIYDKASAPVSASDTPIMTIAIPASNQVSFVLSINASTTLGLAYAITGAVADTDTTAVTLNQVSLNLFYN